MRMASVTIEKMILNVSTRNKVDDVKQLVV